MSKWLGWKYVVRRWFFLFSFHSLLSSYCVWLFKNKKATKFAMNKRKMCFYTNKNGSFRFLISERWQGKHYFLCCLVYIVEGRTKKKNKIEKKKVNKGIDNKMNIFSIMLGDFCFVASPSSSWVWWKLGTHSVSLCTLDVY